jgi:hypothetical protein
MLDEKRGKTGGKSLSHRDRRCKFGATLGAGLRRPLSGPLRGVFGDGWWRGSAQGLVVQGWVAVLGAGFFWLFAALTDDGE